MSSEKLTYSNPRTTVIIDDWPIGSGHRGSAVFKVEEHHKRGERVSRATEKRDRTWGKPKYSTYADKVRIVDGSDGRTYMIHWSADYRQFNVMQGNMKYSQESVHTSDEERFREFCELMEVENE